MKITGLQDKRGMINKSICYGCTVNILNFSLNLDLKSFLYLSVINITHTLV
jgi:hypothetical protein